MKLAAIKPRAARQQRQELFRRARAAAPTLRRSFPFVEHMRIELKFKDQSAYTPVDQTHVMHPAAQAFFSFPCPYSDCDGRFELEPVISEVLSKSAPRGKGEVICAGHRARDGKIDQPCDLLAFYSIQASYGVPADSPREAAEAR